MITFNKMVASAEDATIKYIFDLDGHTTIKFMMFSEKESLEVVKADEKKLETAMTWLKSEGKIVEYYKPPGNDIGSSCGQFLFELDKPKKDEFNISK